MGIDAILREKRKALGLTQEQVANYVGVTTPAVNKWEKGVSCPDILLLPALARLLKTDPNTLLCFQESLTEHEIALFMNEVAETIHTKDFAQGFALAAEKIQEYPNCASLLQSLATLLDGASLVAQATKTEKEAYRAQILSWYGRVVACDDAPLANGARYMLVSDLLEKGEYDEAQKLLDAMPKADMPDKRTLQATLWAKQGKTAQAAGLLERMSLNTLQENLMLLAKLVPLLIKEGAAETAAQLARASQAECEAFGLWQYSAYVVPLTAATARKDKKESLTLLSAMLEEVQKPWDAQACPLWYHMPRKQGTMDCSESFLPPLLDDLEQNPEFDFLRKEPEFVQILAQYRAKNPKKEKQGGAVGQKTL